MVAVESLQFLSIAISYHNLPRVANLGRKRPCFIFEILCSKTILRRKLASNWSGELRGEKPFFTVSKSVSKTVRKYARKSCEWFFENHHHLGLNKGENTFRVLAK